MIIDINYIHYIVIYNVYYVYRSYIHIIQEFLHSTEQVAYNAAMTACERASQWQAPKLEGIACSVWEEGTNTDMGKDHGLLYVGDI
jgi:hypothetical protein